MFAKRGISKDTAAMLADIAVHNGVCFDYFEEKCVFEAVRTGLVKRVLLGSDEPLLILTPGGKKRFPH